MPGTRKSVVSGISLGGWITNLHRACYDTADEYRPIFAGAALDRLFVDSAYRKLTGKDALEHPDRLTDCLNFEDAFLRRSNQKVHALMRKYLWLCVVALLSGCTWFSAESEFLLDNQTSHNLTVTWVERSDDVVRSLPDPVEPDETATIVVGRLLNVTAVTPELFFSRVAVDARIAGEWTNAYVRHPVADDDWTLVADEPGVYTLVLTDADVSP